MSEETTTAEPKQATLTIEEIVCNPKFIELVRDNLMELKKGRSGRPEAKPGFHYKRNWYDRMADSSMLYADVFVNHIGDIWSKKSSLSSEFREVIQYVCNKSLKQLLETKQNEKPNLT